MSQEIPPAFKTERRHTLPPPPPDDSRFFDRVKQSLDSRESYNEFLKVINLFTQGIIDMGRLVKESRNFLAGDSELMRQFRDILGWDEKKERDYHIFEQGQLFGMTRPIVAGFQDRPTRMDMSTRYGSYRKLHPSVSIVLSFVESFTHVCPGGSCHLLWARRHVPLRVKRRMGFSSNMD